MSAEVLFPGFGTPGLREAFAASLAVDGGPGAAQPEPGDAEAKARRYLLRALREPKVRNAAAFARIAATLFDAARRKGAA
jgi:hypothetical protein